jgi:hypothetical protein
LMTELWHLHYSSELTPSAAVTPSWFLPLVWSFHGLKQYKPVSWSTPLWPWCKILNALKLLSTLWMTWHKSFSRYSGLKCKNNFMEVLWILIFYNVTLWCWFF